jgi:MFS transporter, MHS family, proline/betaine transporter
MDNRTLMIVSVGNALEWFDFALFIYLAPMIGAYFFPAHNAASATLAAFAILAAGFICRPLGGIIFGHLGDQMGRAKTLVLSILTISSATGLVGLLPGYAQIGWVATALFILLRLIHGLSVGGEYAGAVIYLGETAPPKNKGFFSSFAIAGANLGFFLATLVSLLLNLLPPTRIGHWGWRLCFIMSGALGLLILYYRLKLQETAVFLHLKQAKKTAQRPLSAVFRESPKTFGQILGLTCMGSTFYYLFFGYMPNYLAQFFGVSLLKSFGCQEILLLAMLILLPLAAACGDRFGRRNLLMISAFGMILLTIPCCYWMQQNTWLMLVMSLSLTAILSALEQGNNLITFVESCPTNIRYTCIALAYNTGNAVFGGTAPLIFSVLTQKIHSLAAGYYVVLMAMISLSVIFTLKIKSASPSEIVHNLSSLDNN